MYSQRLRLRQRLTDWLIRTPAVSVLANSYKSKVGKKSKLPRESTPQETIAPALLASLPVLFCGTIPDKKGYPHKNVHFGRQETGKKGAQLGATDWWFPVWAGNYGFLPGLRAAGRMSCTPHMCVYPNIEGKSLDTLDTRSYGVIPLVWQLLLSRLVLCSQGFDHFL